MATKRDNYNALLGIAEVQSNNELVAFINHELELLDKKNKAERGPTANQIENKDIKKHVLDNIGTARYTITEMVKALMPGTAWADISVSRLTAICTQLVESGDLVREVEKRKAYYQKA